MSYADTIVCYVLDHKAMYDAGILHCDISAGNILICPKKNQMENTCGRLIDLDHGKQSVEVTPTTIPHADPALKKSEDLRQWLESTEIYVDVDVVRTVCILQPTVNKIGIASYLTALLEERTFDKDRPCTIDDLEWPCAVRLYTYVE